MNKILCEIQNFNYEDYSLFIKNRLEALKPSPNFYIGKEAFETRINKNFFGFDTELRTTYAPLLINDIDAYKILLFVLCDSKKLYNLNNSIECDKWIVYGVQKSVFDYFGYGSPNADARNKMYIDAYINNRPLSISEFKDNHLSMCTERAALSHNFFQFLGIQSSFISAPVKIGSEYDLHNYNIVNLSSGTYIYDLVCTVTNENKPFPNAVIAKIDDNTNEDTFNLPKMDIPLTTQSGKEVNIHYIDTPVIDNYC